MDTPAGAPDDPAKANRMPNLTRILQLSVSLVFASPFFAAASVLGPGPEKPARKVTVVSPLPCLETKTSLRNRAGSSPESAAPHTALQVRTPEKHREKPPGTPDSAAPTKLLADLARLLQDSGKRDEADEFLRHAISSREAEGGPSSPELIPLLRQLRAILVDTGRMAEAEEVSRRALALSEAALDPDDPLIAAAVNDLAEILCEVARLDEAEALCRRALAIDAASVGLNDPSAVIHANNLVSVLLQTGRFEEAEKLLRRSLVALEQASGQNHALTANTLNKLGYLLRFRKRSADAETLHRRALAIQEEHLGKDHSSVAVSLGNLASLFQESGHSADAEPLFRRALAIDETSFGPNHPSVARDLNNLAVNLLELHNTEEAERLWRRALAICDRAFGANHPNSDAALRNLGQLLAASDRLPEAEILQQRRYAVMANYERLTHRSHSRWNELLQHHATILSRAGRSREEILVQMLSISRDTFGPGHVYVADLEATLGQYLLLRSEGRRAKAHFEAALRIYEKQPACRIPARMTQVCLATTWRELGENDRARALLTQVVAEWQFDSNPVWPALGQAAFELALCDLRSGRLDDSEHWIRRSLDSFRQIANQPEQVGNAIRQALIAYRHILHAQGKSSGEIEQRLESL